MFHVPDDLRHFGFLGFSWFSWSLRRWRCFLFSVMRRRYWNIVVAFITARVCRSPIRTEWGIAGCLPWMCSFRQSFRVSADKTSDYCCFDQKNKTQQQQEKRFLRQHDFPNTCAHQVYIDAELFQCFVRHIFLFFSSTNKKFIEKKRKKK